MPIIRKLLAQDTECNEFLKVDHPSRFIVNTSNYWQMLFNPNSSLGSSAQTIKIAALFDPITFNNLKIIAYLYDQQNNSVANAASCSFKISKVEDPDWTETTLTTLPGAQIANSYYYIQPLLSLFPTVDFIAGDTLLIEATIIRLGVVHRDRLYVNHLGVYDSIIRLKNDVNYLDITKLDE